MKGGASAGRAGRWGLVLAMLALVGISSLTSFDRYAEQNYEKLFQRAFVTFALARTLNGVISAIQGTEVALTPAGVGVTLTPGQVLDPVNDLIERFSWIMLGATVSLGVQQVLLDIGQWWPLKLLVAVLGVGWLWLKLKQDSAGGSRGPSDRRALMLAGRALIVVLFFRFSVPVAIIANESLYNLFLAPRYETSAQVMEQAGVDIEQAGSEALPGTEEAESDAGLMDTIQRAVDDTRRSLDFKHRVEGIKQRTADLIEHIIQLSVVFILQTAILPVAFLWMFLQVLKGIFRTWSLQNKNNLT